jgi:hypothetical protein
VASSQLIRASPQNQCIKSDLRIGRRRFGVRYLRIRKSRVDATLLLLIATPVMQ